MEEIAFWLSLILKVFTVYFACIAVFTLKKRRRYPKAAPATRFAVVVAARNEEAVIGNLVESVLNQNYPAHLRDIYVVPNNCTDYREAAAVPAGPAAGPALSRGAGRGIHGLFDGEVDAAVLVDADDLDLDLLPFLQMILHVVDVGVGDLRDVHQTRLAFRQGDERAELCDACDLSFQNRTNTKLHSCL